MVASAMILGCAGPTLSTDEAAFFRDADPWGFILFRRNCEDAAQVQALCRALRDCVGRDAPILVDHEGGRVSRLSPHIAPARPAADTLFRLYQQDPDDAVEVAALFGELLARDAYAVGLDVNCVPMADVRQPDAHDIIGDRAVGETPDVVAKLSRAIAEGSLRGGCLPVLKHIPGHGRARSDSHLELPRVSAARDDLMAIDFAPFKALADLPLGMTAHIVYDALDPGVPATLSASVISNVIRGLIGFDGLLMTDDLSMKALTGDFEDRAADSLAAGCDVVLHCNGDAAEMQAVARGVGPLTTEGQRRAEAALKQRRTPAEVSVDALEAAFAARTNAVNPSA